MRTARPGLRRCQCRPVSVAVCVESRLDAGRTVRSSPASACVADSVVRDLVTPRAAPPIPPTGSTALGSPTTASLSYIPSHAVFELCQSALPTSSQPTRRFSRPPPCPVSGASPADEGSAPRPRSSVAPSPTPPHSALDHTRAALQPARFSFAQERRIPAPFAIAASRRSALAPLCLPRRSNGSGVEKDNTRLGVLAMKSNLVRRDARCTVLFDDAQHGEAA